MIVTLLAACSGTSSLAIRNDGAFGQRQGLYERFSRYWSLRAENNLEQGFKLEAPHIQEMIGPNRYKLYMGVMSKARLQDVKVLGVECERPYLCYVRCSMTYVSKAKGSSQREDTRNLRDCWVKVNGTWFHVIRNPLLMPQL